MNKSVGCGVCGSEMSYLVLADAIITMGCEKGCHGGVIIMRAVIEDAINDMDNNKKNTLAEVKA